MGIRVLCPACGFPTHIKRLGITPDGEYDKEIRAEQVLMLINEKLGGGRKVFSQEKFDLPLPFALSLRQSLTDSLELLNAAIAEAQGDEDEDDAAPDNHSLSNDDEDDDAD